MCIRDRDQISPYSFSSCHLWITTCFFETFASCLLYTSKLFGSITSKDIAEALEKQEGMKIDKKKIEMKTPIKQAGETEVTLKLFTEISAQLKVSVTIA